MRHRSTCLVLLAAALSLSSSFNRAAGAETARVQKVRTSFHLALQQMRKHELNEATSSLIAITKLPRNSQDPLENGTLAELQSDAYKALGDIARQRSNPKAAIYNYQQSLQRQEELFGNDSSRLVPILEKLTTLYEETKPNANLAHARQRLIQLKSAATDHSNLELFRKEVNLFKEQAKDPVVSAHIVDLLSDHPAYLSEVLAMRDVYPLLTRPQDKLRLLTQLRKMSKEPMRLNTRSLSRVAPVMIAIHFGLVYLGDENAARSLARRLEETYAQIPASVSEKIHSIAWHARLYDQPVGRQTTIMLTRLALALQRQSSKPMPVADANHFLHALNAVCPVTDADSASSKEVLSLMLAILPVQFESTDGDKLELAAAYLDGVYPRLAAKGDMSTLPRFHRLLESVARSTDPPGPEDFWRWAVLTAHAPTQFKASQLSRLLARKMIASWHAGKTDRATIDSFNESEFIGIVWAKAAQYLGKDNCREATRYLQAIYDTCQSEPLLSTDADLKAKLLNAIIISTSMGLDEANLVQALAALDTLYRQHPELLSRTTPRFRGQLHFPPIPAQHKRYPQIERMLSRAILQSKCQPSTVIEVCFELGAMGYYYADSPSVERIFARAGNARANLATKQFWPSWPQIEVEHLDIMAWCRPQTEVERLGAKLLALPESRDFPLEKRKRVMVRYASAIFSQNRYDECLHYAKIMEQMAAVPDDLSYRLQALATQAQCYEAQKNWAKADELYARTMAVHARIPQANHDWLWNYTKSAYDNYCKEKKRRRK